MCVSSHRKKEEEERGLIHTYIANLGDVVPTLQRFTWKLYSLCAPAAIAKKKKRRDVEYTQKLLPWETWYQPCNALPENCMVHECQQQPQRERGGHLRNTHRHSSLGSSRNHPAALTSLVRQQLQKRERGGEKWNAHRGTFLGICGTNPTMLYLKTV